MTYPGGKGTSYQQIINQIPPHLVYIEPFAGGAAVMRRKAPAVANIAVDLDFEALIALSGEAAASTIVGDGVTAVSGAALRTAVTSITAMVDAAAAPGMTMAAVSASNGDACRHASPAISPLPSIPADIAVPDDGTWLIHADALEFLTTYSYSGDEFVYIDPPYLLAVRSSRREIYRHEFHTEQEHRQLIDIAQALPCNVALSGYWSKLYANRLNGWRAINWQVMTRGGVLAREWLWMNYPKPKQLHEYTYLGNNFRERERIRRKAARWVARFAQLPTLERRAIVNQLRNEGLI